MESRVPGLLGINNCEKKGKKQDKKKELLTTKPQAGTSGLIIACESCLAMSWNGLSLTSPPGAGRVRGRAKVPPLAKADPADLAAASCLLTLLTAGQQGLSWSRIRQGSVSTREAYGESVPLRDSCAVKVQKTLDKDEVGVVSHFMVIHIAGPLPYPDWLTQKSSLSVL